MHYAKLSLFGLALVCLLSAVGCGPTVKDRLAGTWQGSVELDQAAIDKKKAAADNPIAAMAMEAMLKPMLANFRFDITLNADGTMSSEGTVGKSTGTWELKSSTDTQAVVVTKEGEKSHEHTLLFDADFMKGTGGFTMAPPGEMAEIGKFRFKRKT